MPLSANTANVVLLEDNPRRAVVKIWNYLNSGNTGEANVMKVNAATLVGVTQTLTFNAAQYATLTGHHKFLPGETITANGGTQAVGQVVSLTPSVGGANGSLKVVLSNTANAFAGSDQIVGSRGSILTLNGVASPFLKLSIASAWWSISGTGSIGIEFAGANSTTWTTALLLSGAGFIGKPWPITIPNPQTSTTDPNIYISTYNQTGPATYMLILELRKGDGYGTGDTG